MTTPHLVLLDGSALLYRAFHSANELTRPSDDAPVGGVYRMVEMMWRMFVRAGTHEGITSLPRPATHVIAVFDAPGPCFRHAIYPQYKANRSIPSSDFSRQKEWLRDAIRSFGIRTVDKTGFEADDLIATYAENGAARGCDVLIVSSDKDLYQLISPRIRAMSRRTNPTPADVIYDEAAVLAKFGVPPHRLGDYLALMGDEVDGIPGVMGVGPVKAAKLINDFGSLDEIFNRVGDIKQPGLRSAIAMGEDDARLARKLVALDTNVDVEAIEGFAWRGPDLAGLRTFCEIMEFPSFLKQIDDLRQGDLLEA